MVQNKNIEGEDFRRMQLLQLEMLVELDRVCKKNDIKYQIAFGTLLGAVRHKGYIPWDDDADVVMLREEYEKLKKCADQFDPDVCFFQDHSTESEYRWGYGKLRKTNTKHIRVGQEHLKFKTGVFIDIFPLDDAPKSIIGQIIQDRVCFCLRKIMWSEVGRVVCKGSLKLWYFLLSRIPLESVFKVLEHYTKKSRNDTPNDVRVLCFVSIGKMYIKHPLKERYAVPKKWFQEFADYTFEGKQLTGIKDYDGFLKFTYGDYMQLPPEDQRDPHSPASYYEF